MNPSSRQRRRRPWEDDDVATEVTSSSTAPESTSSTAVKEESQFVQPSVHSTSHRDAPHLRLETTASQVVSEPAYAGLEHFQSAVSSSPGSKRQRTDYTSSGSASASASAFAASSVSYQFSEDGRCCSLSCQGNKCERIRQLSRLLLSEINAHEVLVHGAGGEGEMDNAMATVVTDVMEIVVERLRQSNISLKKLLDASPLKPGAFTSPPVVDTGAKEIGATESSVSPMLTRASPSSFNPPRASRGSASDINPIEDLHNQLTLKSIKIQTLQSENHSLQQKLKHEIANFAELDRKFEVADAEIVYLTTEKERLDQTIVTLEKQIKDLEISRNEARKSSSEMASQYLRMFEMAGRLHSRPAGSDKPSSQQGEVESRPQQREEQEGSENSHQAKIVALEQEIKRLRNRNLRLENAAAAAKQATQNVEWILKNALEDSES